MMLTFQEQLDLYPALKKYIIQIPHAYPVTKGTVAWRIYGQKNDGGGWASKDFILYRDAFTYFKQHRNKYHDISITSKRRGYEPPGRIVRIRRDGAPVMIKTPTGRRQMTKLVPVKPPADHAWCMFCRRFTVFTWFNAHHAFKGDLRKMMDPAARRCTVCGVREATGAYR